MPSPPLPGPTDTSALPEDPPVEASCSCRWTVTATARRVSTLRRDVVAFAEERAVADPPIADLRLALGEALANVVMHAFPPGEVGTVTVALTVDTGAREVRVHVCDDGRGMTPRLDSPGLGLGMALIGKLADRTEVRAVTQGTGTHVGMAFGFDAPTVLQ